MKRVLRTPSGLSIQPDASKFDPDLDFDLRPNLAPEAFDVLGWS